MRIPSQITVKFVMAALTTLLAPQAWAQSENGVPSQSPVPAYGRDRNSTPPDSATNTPDAYEDRMITPAVVSGQAYPTVLTSEERSNYLHLGMNFTTAYTDNALAFLESHPVSDVSFSIAPTVALDETTPRQHLLLSYAPGFTFYRNTNSLNQADQNASVSSQYRLSPHVTFSAQDRFQKTSNVFNQQDMTSIGIVSGGTGTGNFSVISPIADRLINSATTGLVYQFGRNDMIGGSGAFSNLHYPNLSQVTGLFDSSSQAGFGFYAHRFSKANYLGATYQYQRLLAYPGDQQTETQTHAALLFYSVYPTPRFSVSLFGGPQYSDTPQIAPLRALQQWTPAAGASASWQGPLNTVAISYLHTISSAGGLVSAVEMDSATAAIRQRMTRTLTASMAGGYVNNKTVGSPQFGSTNGHSISGTAALQQQFGAHLAAQFGYTRLHQTYSNVPVLSANPDTNREFISVSYQFVRPLGR